MALILSPGLFASFASAESVSFDHDAIGQPPAGWTATQTGSGAARWTVEKDASSPGKSAVLQQSGEATYPVCLKNEPSFKDGFVEVRFKPVAGKEDQAGGVVWRARDADNYYVCRANALEDNVTIYHTLHGRRVSFQNVDRPVKSGAWHTLRVEFRGSRFVVIFDGQKVIDTTDESLPSAGKVGVWTKSDSVTQFSDFSYGVK